MTYLLRGSIKAWVEFHTDGYSTVVSVDEDFPAQNEEAAIAEAKIRIEKILSGYDGKESFEELDVQLFKIDSVWRAKYLPEARQITREVTSRKIVITSTESRT